MNKRFLALAATALVVAASVVVPASAAEAATKTYGVVKFQLVTPAKKALHLKHVDVTIHSKTYKTYYYKQTDSKGQITFPKVLAGTKLIVDIYPGTNQAYADHTTSVTAKAKKTVSLVGALPKGATISGHVGAGAGDLNKGWVWAFPTDRFGRDRFAQTDASGDYTMVGLDSGSYTVVFNSHMGDDANSVAYGESFWHDASSIPGATLVTVTEQTPKAAASAVTGIDGGVVAGFSLNGTVIGQPVDSNGDPDTLDTVDFESTDGAQDGDYTHFAAGSTQFTRHLGAGSFTVEIYTANGGDWYWTGDGNPLSDDIDDAVPFTVTGTEDQSITFDFGAAAPAPAAAAHSHR